MAVKTFVATKKGRDVQTTDGKHDGHVRLEEHPDGGHYVVPDVFRSGIKDPEKAHVQSYAGSVAEINEELRYLGFAEQIRALKE